MRPAKTNIDSVLWATICEVLSLQALAWYDLNIWKSKLKVKMWKAQRVRSTFGSLGIEKMHGVAARGTFPSENDQNASGNESMPSSCWDHLTGNRAGMCHVQRPVDGNWGCRNLAKWNGHYLSIYIMVYSRIFWGVRDCISQVGYVSLHGRCKLPFAKKWFLILIPGPNRSPRPQLPSRNATRWRTWFCTCCAKCRCAALLWASWEPAPCGVLAAPHCVPLSGEPVLGPPSLHAVVLLGATGWYRALPAAASVWEPALGGALAVDRFAPPAIFGRFAGGRIRGSRGSRIILIGIARSDIYIYR